MAFRLVKTGGLIHWEGERDDQGHRTYTLKMLVETTDKNDGPATALLTPGLPVPGTRWIVGNDLDLWAWCTPKVRMTPRPQKPDFPNKQFVLTFTFTTAPLTRSGFSESGIGQGGGGYGGQQGVENPLLEPQKVSGHFVKYTKELHTARKVQLKNAAGTVTRDGLHWIVNSAWEQQRGPLVEFDHSYPTVRIEQNVPVLNFPLAASMINRVNGTTIWGFNPRCVKLSNFTWERKFHPVVVVYYTRVFEFDINYDTFDRDIADQGSRVINGRWNGGVWELVNIQPGDIVPDVDDASHYMLAEDRRGNPMRVPLDGDGKPASGFDTQGTIHIEHYEEANFLSLGVPIFL